MKSNTALIQVIGLLIERHYRDKCSSCIEEYIALVAFSGKGIHQPVIVQVRYRCIIPICCHNRQSLRSRIWGNVDETACGKADVLINVHSPIVVLNEEIQVAVVVIIKSPNPFGIHPIRDTELGIVGIDTVGIEREIGLLQSIAKRKWNITIGWSRSLIQKHF